MSGWISIDDRMPEEDRCILVSGFNYNNQIKGRWVQAAWRVGDSFYSNPDPDGDDYLYPPTHWMPLPEPPK